MSGRTVGARGLFAIVYTTSVSSIYFALGVVAHRALGLTPLVFLAAGLFFGLAAMTYLEGASLHAERGGSTVFARYGFNELVSFVTGWAVLLDYIILVAVTAVAATNYLAAFWSPLGHGASEIVLAVGIVVYVVTANIVGLNARRLHRRVLIAAGDLVLQFLIIALGLFLVFHPERLVDSIHLGSAPRWEDVVFALTIATIAFTGLEAAAGLAPEVQLSRRSLKRLLGPGVGLIVLVYIGISMVGISALPVVDGETTLGTGEAMQAPLVAIAKAFHPHWLAQSLSYVVAAAATIALIAAANSAMLGLARLGYSLATNRQIPSALGRLHPTRGTPYVLITLAGIAAAALAIPTDVDFLVGIYAFGAMLAFTIAHASIVALRFREPDKPCLYRMPVGVRLRGATLPVPAVLGGVVSASGLVSVLVLHAGARYVGLAWLAFGLALYVIYRTSTGKSLTARVTIPERALRTEAGEESEFGSILVPIMGGPLDDDIIQTAGRLAGEERDELESRGATIEALWVFEVPLSLPLDAVLPEAQVQRARIALARAKAVGEEYEGVEVATAMVRARRAGQGIVSEARRRGVEAIVLAADEPTRIRGGALLGGAGGPRDNFVGEVTKYVIRKAECRVILTAPPVGGGSAGPAPGGAGEDGDAPADLSASVPAARR